MQKKLFSAAVAAALLISACGGSKDPLPTVDCTGSTPTYTANVKEIFDNNCASGGCHDSGSKEAGYDLSTYAGSKSGAAKDALLGSINQLSGYTKMPKGSAKLSDADIKIVTCWIDNGTPE